MNRSDRDLAIIGVGAFLTVLCLLFNWPFAVRVVAGGMILVVFLIIALMRLGPDREPIEEHLRRLWNKLRSPRKFTFQGGDHPRALKTASSDHHHKSFSAPARGPVMETAPANASTLPFPAQKSSSASNRMPAGKPISFSTAEVGVYRLIPFLLGVIGIYFIYWLAIGGSAEIGLWMQTMIFNFTH